MKIKKIYWAFLTYFEYFFWKELGWKSYLGRPAYITRRRNISLGCRVRIMPGARLECGPNGRIVIGDNVSIGPNCNITAYNEVVIGAGVTISANCFITDMDHSFAELRESVMDQRNEIKSVGIGNYSFIGANCVVLAGTYLGHACVVGANSTVRGRFGEEGSIIAGNLARVIGGRCK